MASQPTLRPGIATGAYPERRDTDESDFERKARALLGRWTRPSSSDLRELVARVSREGDAIKNASERELQDCVRGVRNELAIEGLTDDLLSRSFALVREVAKRTLGTPHYDVQLMGGWVMARGMLAEMQTGEGKTLTATLPACAAALAGIPVHVVSVNDYLVERDADAMRPIYSALAA